MRYPALSPAPSKKELQWGLVWLAINLMVLPTVLTYGNYFLGNPLSSGLLNFVYYCVNFAVTFWIFRHFLASSWKTALQRPFMVLWYAVLAYLGYQVLTELVTLLILSVYPTFGNVNDSNIYSMLEEDLIPLAIGTVFLVPLAEEVMYRGLVFRGLFDKNPALAYIVSMLAFASIHVMGYVGAYPPLTLLMCFLQYLPAGYCLCWCYRQTGTIIAPILMHMLVNGTSIYYFVR